MPSIREGSNVRHPGHGATYVIGINGDTAEIADPQITGETHLVPVATLTLDPVDEAAQYGED